MAPLESFSLFPKFSLEFRDMVWGFAISPARVIEITSNSRLLEPSPNKIYTRHRTPPLLHTNRESRKVALKFYRPAFSHRLEHPMYFDFARDWLYTAQTTLIQFRCHFRDDNTQNDHRLVQHPMLADEDMPPLITLRNSAESFPALKSLRMQ
ncbi:hypothetical protein L207DRAFT_531942 [Hyaloscypha variabilis F]|uniref:2EXR domain-containing protein n=1 Tax=Hyaloscypha variabilis (strain UAMH 11265 / GT02V1 / F) TaxID=1149755 RepID=A0A2J6RGN4_HYAVF|nr:hypothetical protein L207DRAFT_531942 [Hyaloscypha variabilis F]